MTDVLTVQEIAENLDTIIDEMAINQDKVVTFAADDGRRFVLISPQHYQRLKQVTAADPEASEPASGLSTVIND